MFVRFEAPVISDDLTLVEADPFDLMFRAGGKTCTISYNGPTNAILSESSQCVYALNVKEASKTDLVIAPSSVCLPKITTDDLETRHFAVSKCQKKTPMDEIGFVQIKSYSGQYHVYCPESNMTIEGVKQKCPNEVLMFPIRTSFKVNEAEFVGSRLSVAHTETLNSLFTVKANWHLQPKINWTTLLVNTTDDFKEIHLSDYHAIYNYWSTIGCGIVILVLIVVVFYVVRKWLQVPRRVSVIARPIRHETIRMEAIENQRNTDDL
jgi:hypothetical protein